MMTLIGEIVEGMDAFDKLLASGSEFSRHMNTNVFIKRSGVLEEPEEDLEKP